MFELKNGASIDRINLRADASLNGGRGGHVLAKAGDEWVTWQVDGYGGTYSGHYFGDDYAEALSDYRERSGGAR